MNADYVIIGSSAAGVSCISAIRRHDPKGTIITVTKDRYPPYTPLFLADYIMKDIEEKDLFFKGMDFFERMNVTVLKGKIAEQIDPQTKELILENGEKIKYGKILIATGGYPFIPPIKGVDKKEVYTLQTLDDSKKIIEKSRDASKAVVVGAGPIGLEAAYALRKLGLDVVVVELLDRVLPLMLEKEAADMIMKEFTDMGIRIILGTGIEEITGDKHVNGVVAGKEEISTDLVIMATGVRPNVEMARNSGIEVNKGIIVNRMMETSVKDIYAAGDVAEAEDAFGDVCLTPTWVNAVRQGEVAGLNMAGLTIEYEGSIRVNIMKGIGTPVVSLGHTSATLRNTEYEEEEFNGRGIYRKAFFDGKCLLGFQSVGSHKDIRLAGMLQILVRKRIPVEDRRALVRKGHLVVKNIPELYHKARADTLKSTVLN
jgi:NAD(P)H-nitrite reductase large subunit